MDLAAEAQRGEMTSPVFQASGTFQGERRAQGTAAS